MNELPDIMRMMLALGIVILLMLLIAYAMRRYPVLQKYLGTMMGGMTGGVDTRARMEIVSSLMIDARHRLVIVRIDDAEKTFLLSPETATEVSI